MCDICDTAKRFPSTRHSLEFLAQNMFNGPTPPPCVDKLIGELVGVDFEFETVDRKLEADWEQANHGTS